MTDSPKDHISDPARPEDSASTGAARDEAARDGAGAGNTTADSTETAQIHPGLDNPAPAAEATQPLAGEPVASMGDGKVKTAATLAIGAAEPILYIEFRKDGTAIDPGPWWVKSATEKARG